MRVRPNQYAGGVPCRVLTVSSGVQIEGGDIYNGAYPDNVKITLTLLDENHFITTVEGTPDFVFTEHP